MNKTYKVGVRDLVTFLYQSGDLSSENFQNVVALEGINAHQHIQGQYDIDDISEYPIEYMSKIEGYEFTLSGRIDGVKKKLNDYRLEEIKSTKKNIFDDYFFYSNEHLAQLKLYSYMFMKNNHLFDLNTELTYIQISDYKTRGFEFYFTLEELEPFYIESLTNYLQWLQILEAHQIKKEASIETLKFPFGEYRKGQREMMTYVYSSVKQKETLFAVAPTGIGKTMAALFSSIKALDNDKQKIFYATAKNQGKDVAIEALQTLHQNGLETKMIEITSKDTICFLEKRDCDPKKCPFAKGFFDRLTEAMQDIFMNETILTKEVIEEYARKHMVCPFEYSLYVSYFVDVIVCDYNYVFDPRVHLIRYFDDETYQPIVLVDEAHNLISRSRDMYSAKLSKEDLIDLRKKGSKLKPSIRNQVNKVIEYFDTLDEKLAEAHLLSNDLPDYTLSEKVTFLMKKIQSSLKENQDYPKKSEVMEGYLKLLNYSVIMEYYNQAYKTNVMRQGDDLVVSLSCLDASEYLKQTINNKIQSAVFFSATLSPLDYYKTLINQNEGYDLTIASPFDPSRLKVIVMDQINTRFQHREASLDVIVEVIKKVVAQKKGNYIVFFPSYQYLNAVKKVLPKSLDALIIVQERDMNVQSRDETLLKFRADSPISQLGFFVMGGVFSEGIDYVGNMLNGVIIVGVGMPMLNHENDQLKSYYDLTFQKGFDYAYTYPGMNKVIQAVGRVIRRDDDYGVAILIDDRFSKSVYRKLMPSHWTNQQVCKTPEALEMVLSDFWLEMEKKKD